MHLFEELSPPPSTGKFVGFSEPIRIPESIFQWFMTGSAFGGPTMGNGTTD